jgi:MOSC domain-containing protein YiiM
MAKVECLSIGKPKHIQVASEQIYSGIRKETINEVYLSSDGFVGDDVANIKYHGGPERAVCFYAIEHYKKWELEFNKVLPIPAFGENLTISNMVEDDVCIGNIYEIGEAIVQITQGRVPCATISKSNHVDTFLSRVVETGFTGYFAKVLKEGKIVQGANITLIEKDPNGISIQYANQVFFRDRKNKEAVSKLLQVKALAKVWRDILSK